MKPTLLLMAASLLFSAAATADVQCGNFKLTSSDDGFMHINGVRPESQKFTFLGHNGDYNSVKYEWVVATNQPGQWLGIEYIKRNDTKRFMNVQQLQANMDLPKRFSTFDCVKTS